MKLSNAALEMISEKRKTLLALALALDISEQWMRRVIENNKSNGPLTTVTALGVIRQETGLNDSEILVDSEAEVDQPSAKI
jgi:hypothetical protein